MKQLVKNQTVNLTSAPSSPLAGDTYYDSFLGALRVYNGAIWLTLRPVLPATNEFRLTLEQGVPVSTTDQTAKTTIYCCPVISNSNGNILMLSDGSNVFEAISGEFAMLLPTVTNDRCYDVFAFQSTLTPSSTNTSTDIVTFASPHGWATGTRIVPTTTGGGLTGGSVYFFNAASSTTGSFHGTLANALSGASKWDLTASITSSLTGLGLEVLAWTNNTTRATAIVGAPGFLAKSGDSTRRLMGTIKTTSTTTTADSLAAPFLWNADNRVNRPFKGPLYTGGADLSTTSATPVVANAGFQTPVLAGLATYVDVRQTGQVYNTGASAMDGIFMVRLNGGGYYESGALMVDSTQRLPVGFSVAIPLVAGLNTLDWSWYIAGTGTLKMDQFSRGSVSKATYLAGSYAR